MKALVLVCNHERTLSLNALAISLKKVKSVKICAIVYDNLAQNLLVTELFDDVIYLNENSNKQINLDEKFNDNYIDYKSVYTKDRKLKYLSSIKAIKILKNQYLNIERGLNKYSSLNFIGEISWAAEELIYLYSKYHKFNYYTLIPVRFVDRKWAFVNGLSEKNLIKFNVCENDKQTSKLNLGSHPDYFYEVTKQLNTFKRIFNFVFKKKLKTSIPNMILKKILHIILSDMLDFFKKTTISNSKKNYLYGFQVQPEASVDYLAPEHHNQFLLIDKILLNLKPDEKLVLKDHPGETIFWGGLKKIKYLFNSKIIYLKTNLSVFDISNDLNGSISITGTLAGELAMKGIRTVTLKEVFFNKLHYCSYFNNLEGAFSYLRSKNESLTNDELISDNNKFLKFINEYCFDGYSYETKQFGFVDPLFINHLKNILINNNLV